VGGKLLRNEVKEDLRVGVLPILTSRKISGDRFLVGEAKVEPMPKEQKTAYPGRREKSN